MAYDTYNYSIHGIYKPPYNLNGQSFSVQDPTSTPSQGSGVSRETWPCFQQKPGAFALNLSMFVIKPGNG
jgi:hypothetical protein